MNIQVYCTRLMRQLTHTNPYISAACRNVIPYLSLHSWLETVTASLSVLTVLQYPFILEDPEDVPLEECLVARPQLFITCQFVTCQLGRAAAQSQSHLLVQQGPLVTSESRWYS